MSSVVPTSQFSRLCLEESLGRMAPTARSQVERELSRRNKFLATLGTFQDSSSGHEDSDSSVDEQDDDDDDDDTSSVVLSPATKVSYDISALDLETQSEVRQLFRKTPASEPPSLVLQWCQLNQEEQVYAFQLHEVIPRSIRIGSPTSKYRSPECNCMTDTDKPCKHLIYLLDQLNYFSSDNLLSEPVQRLGPRGLSKGIGEPFERISNFHLDLLASNLHCGVGSPESRAEIDRTRVEEAREVLATVAESDADDYAVQHYRPDIFESRGSILQEHGIVSSSDLTKTVAKMLITNTDFFAYFLKLLGPTSKARDPFRKIQQHVDRVLGELDAYSRDPAPSAAAGPEGPRDVPWAAAHVRRAVSTIQYLLENREDAPSPAERASAARALVRILHAVVFDWNRNVPSSTAAAAAVTPALDASDDAAASSGGKPRVAASHISPTDRNNLYQCLIGSETPAITASPAPFILGTLAQLPEQNQWIETLEEIEARLAAYGPPARYALRLRDLVVRMRSSRPAAAVAGGGGERAGPGLSRSAAGSKRSGEGSGREGGAKRAR